MFEYIKHNNGVNMIKKTSYVIRYYISTRVQSRPTIEDLQQTDKVAKYNKGLAYYNILCIIIKTRFGVRVGYFKILNVIKIKKIFNNFYSTGISVFNRLPTHNIINISMSLFIII